MSLGRYWVDANVFIWGNREPYPLPGMRPYWNWFESQVDDGKIISHSKCIEEITAGEKGDDEDLIVQWVKTRKNKLVACADTQECQELVGQICQYCFDTFGPVKTPAFTKGADIWLIARAKLDKGTVVTQESTKKMVRIPHVCDQFKVPHMTIFKMNSKLNLSL